MPCFAVVSWWRAAETLIRETPLPIVIISFEYTLSTDKAFPAAHDDALHALEWAHKNADRLSVDPNKIFVSGGSAGGNLAIMTALQTSLPVAGLIVTSPVVDCPFSNHTSYQTFSGQRWPFGYGLDFSMMQAFFATYTRVPYDDDFGLEKVKKAWCSEDLCPIFNDNLGDLPPTLIFISELDILRDENLLFVDTLREAGVPVWKQLWKNTPHNAPFSNLCAIYPVKCRHAALRTAYFIEHVLTEAVSSQNIEFK
eukprot:Platyproteum_vivax@DN3626_c0_g1_i2.p1